MQDRDRTSQLNVSHLLLPNSSPHQTDLTPSKKTSNLNAKFNPKNNSNTSLSCDLVLISKLFEAQAKKHLFEAQVLARDIDKIEKLLLHLEMHWQELEKLTYEENNLANIPFYLGFLTKNTQKKSVVLSQRINHKITVISNLKQDLKLAETAAEYCKHRAEQELKQGEENWALASLVRKKTYLNTAIILKFSLKQQIPQLEILKYYLFVLDSWLVLAKEINHTIQNQSCGDSTRMAQSLLRQRIQIPDHVRHLRRELAWIKQEHLLFGDTNRTP